MLLLEPNVDGWQEDRVPGVREPESELRAALFDALSSAELRATGERTQADGRLWVELAVTLPEDFSLHPAPEVATSARSAESSPALTRAIRNAFVHEAALARILERIGRPMTVDELVSVLIVALEPVERTVEPTDPAGQFTSSELGELAEAGADLTPLSFGSGAGARTAGSYTLLLATACTVSTVAQRLRVDESRVRQRLAEGSLHGVKVGRSWRLPAWQFVGEHGVHGTLPGLDIVLPRVPEGLHPVAVWRWMSTATGDLELDGEPTSPGDWLLAGGDPRRVAELAVDL